LTRRKSLSSRVRLCSCLRAQERVPALRRHTTRRLHSERMAGSDDGDSKNNVEEDKSGVASTKREIDVQDDDERTPKRLKSMEPDLTVVVGGKEFYHYQSVLCLACPFIDTMLSHNMKESNKNRIEFPDKDPAAWLLVYKFLDLTMTETEKDDMFQSIIGDAFGKDGLKLLAWFDFLGMETLVKKYDHMLAIRLETTFEGSYPGYGFWRRYKHHPAPLSLKVFTDRMKLMMMKASHQLSRLQEGEWPSLKQNVDDIKKYLLDEEIGNELWEFLLSKVDFPPIMLQATDKADIVSSPIFIGILELCGRSLEKPKPFKEFRKSL